eukprot:TRINITY_DN18777_c0_g1_i1.p1 TRINITY_DN18777_c0_g1~~TRINITY_DN18777_c0_g1_i1.p1  ORF type:complete len:376 (+),score=54.88 TRINITY_DN18777_c0_g1_i1:53-1180(+)
MMKPLSGTTVVEMTTMIAGPAAGAQLADFGAEVIKIEPEKGDIFRSVLGKMGLKNGAAHKSSPLFASINRGKKSAILSREAILSLLGQADVLLVNIRTKSLEKQLGTTLENLRKAYPKLIICVISGYGLDNQTPGYDSSAFWARSGLAQAFTADHPKYGVPEQHRVPPSLPGGVGDIACGMAAVNGILAAIIQREKTGQGSIVSASLLRTGAWLNSNSLTTYLSFGKTFSRSRNHPINPLYNLYKSSDGVWFTLLGFDSSRHWPAIQKLAGISDPKFETAASRSKHSGDLVAVLDSYFQKQSFDELSAKLTSLGVWWETVQTPSKVVQNDPHLFCNSGDQLPVLKTPVDITGANISPSGPSPSLGQHTNAVSSKL